MNKSQPPNHSIIIFNHQSIIIIDYQPSTMTPFLFRYNLPLPWAQEDWLGDEAEGENQLLGQWLDDEMSF